MKNNQYQNNFDGQFNQNNANEGYFSSPESSQYSQPIDYDVNQYNGNQGKKKKPIYKKWWFILIVIIAVIVTAGKISDALKENEKIVWADMIMGDILPEPPETRGVINDNTADKLRVKINRISEKQYAQYIEACKEKGFTVDENLQSSYFEAYNENGNKLNLSYYESDKQMKIELSAPMKFGKISWPKSTAGKLVPVPKSLSGNFTYENEDGFSVYISNMTKDDFSDYVSACADKGFTVDYDKSSNYYSADNAQGWHISLRYEGFNIVSISVSAPDDTESSETTTEKTTADHSNDNTENDLVGLDPDFKAAMDSYEEFMNEYVEFMEKYKESDGNDPALLSDYAEYMKKYAEMAESFEKWEDEELNNAETAYYIDVQARVSKKLLEVSE